MESSKMKTLYIVILASIFALSACSVNNPRVSLGKKCVEKDKTIVYSYVWVYDKKEGLYADEKTCEKIK